MVCRHCPEVWSCFCFGSDMLQHNKVKHQNNVLQILCTKHSINDVEDSAVPSTSTASISVTSYVELTMISDRVRHI